MKLPKKLKLFGEKWKIVPVQPSPILQQEYRGMTIFPMKEIHILIGNTSEQSTLLHEIIHVAEEMTGANLTEDQVVALERGLWNIFSTNPKLLEYFIHGTTTITDNSPILQKLLELRESTSDDSSDHGYEREI